MNPPVILARGLSKRYRLGVRPRYRTLRENLMGVVRSPLRRLAESRGGASEESMIWALKDVSFEVRQGEVLGIIGRNGAGKSTLLKILARITEPTEGSAELLGRVGSMLEVGTGFHPELTGRENIYLSGAILGMRKSEIRQKFDEIVTFAEIERFLDTPVKRYSTGMYVRLAFSVAAHLDPEILLVDEVLAVGDAAFQKKCLGRMGDVARHGRTVLFVSHNMAAVQQLTQSCLLLEGGILAARGPTSAVIQQYMASAMQRSASVYDLTDAPRSFPELDRSVEYIRVELEDSPSTLVSADQDLSILMTVKGNESVDSFRFSMTIYRADGSPVGNLFGADAHSIREGEEAVFRMQLSELRLAPGPYHCALATGRGNHLTGMTDFDIVLNVLHFEVMSEGAEEGIVGQWNPAWGPIRFKEPSVTRVR